ncbi:MAG TPA: CHC2 zinc finger domain-containing protein [Anaerolineae bacterium]|nr:CHC2 zinc finger domain-containing protein [Anaerolineae bacterium]HQK13683.1 CHC2 zinc finger domain-containing protein [Anaerolineae bacterium]
MYGLKKCGVVSSLELEATPKRKNRVHNSSTVVLKSQVFERALYWISNKVPLVPLQPKSKSLITGFGAYSQRITTEDTAWYWFGERACNLAVVTGHGLVVLDFDCPGEYDAWRMAWPDLADTYTERTARGMHVFLAGDSASGRLPGRPGVEIKGRGAVVMSAPSVHPGGFVYQAVDPGALIKQAPGDFPLLSEHPQALSKGIVTCAGGKDALARIKAAYSVLDLAQSLTRLKTNNGRWWHGRCPFHDDKRPSFWVDAERQLWGCYACGMHGDVVNLYAIQHGLSVQDAIRALATGVAG